MSVLLRVSYLFVLFDACHGAGMIVCIAAQMAFETSSSGHQVSSKRSLTYFMCVGVWLVLMSVHHVCAVPRDWKRVVESLGLELQTAVSHPVGAGNCTQVL